MGKEEALDKPEKISATRHQAAGARPLIRTKIRIPRRRQDLLPRRRLVNFIHAQLDRKLILISAPAGYGKTSLLTDFASDTDLPVCWYTLDPFDRDLHVFLEHLVGAISLRFPDFGEQSRAYLQATTDPGANLYATVATLVQEIYDTIPEYFFLVLDDHHTIGEQEQVNEFLDHFLTYVDENCHLILASRTLPALPSLPLLVARRQAAGLSIDELRFTPQEIQDLARQNYDMELSLEQASKLAEHTGGWITGLLLTSAHRWEQSRGDLAVRGRIQVNLYDYLSRQVLDRQPPALRDFLLASSVLDELSPKLCREVLEIEGPGRMMDQLRMRNLFIIEFEGNEDRLRFHDLFRDFLQDTLREENQARYRELTLRAAGAYAARSEWQRAVSRYLDLEDYEPVVQIVEQTFGDLFHAGRWDMLSRWIDALPEMERRDHPWFLVQRGEIHMERGENTQAQELFAKAERLFLAKGDDAGHARVMAIEGYFLRSQGRYDEAIARSQETLRLVEGKTREERLSLAIAYRNTGLCQNRQGHAAEGQEALLEALHLYKALDAPYDVAMIHHDLGLIHETLGDLEGAVSHYQAALQRWQVLKTPGPWANTLNGLGVIYHLQGRYEEALEALNDALDKIGKAGDQRVEAFIWASLGDLHSDRGDYERAEQAYTQALEVATRAHTGFVLAYAQNALGNVACTQGNLSESKRLLDKAMTLATKQGSRYQTGLCHTSQGLLAAEKGELLLARDHLDQAIELFDSGGFKKDLAQACLIRAQIAFRAEEPEAALADLQSTLNLIDELGFDQFFVVEGQRLPKLLRYALERGLGLGILPQVLVRIETHQAKLAARPEPVVQVEAPPTLKISALGPPQVELDGKQIQWATTQSRDLFFCLLQHPQGLRKEELGAIFWPDHPPHKLDGIFRSTLYRLRRAIFRECVVYEDSLYRVGREGNYSFDVEGFEQLLDQAEQAASPDEASMLLEEALTLYAGDYLEGVYADWCSLERERLREHHLNALESLAKLHTGQGRLNRAIKEYQQLINQDPYREPAHRELMRCYYRLGDRATAVRQYQSCAEILREDLGLSPSPETEALYLKIIG